VPDYEEPHSKKTIISADICRRSPSPRMLMEIRNMRFNLNMMNDFGNEKCRQAKRQDLPIMRLFYALHLEK
jgi:hypothetical protein